MRRWSAITVRVPKGDEEKGDEEKGDEEKSDPRIKKRLKVQWFCFH
jgi:hypothetical protein